MSLSPLAEVLRAEMRRLESEGKPEEAVALLLDWLGAEDGSDLHAAAVEVAKPMIAAGMSPVAASDHRIVIQLDGAVFRFRITIEDDTPARATVRVIPETPRDAEAMQKPGPLASLLAEEVQRLVEDTPGAAGSSSDGITP